MRNLVGMGGGLCKEPDWGKFGSLLHYLGMKRAGANLHLGEESWGCITVDYSAMDDYYKLTDLLERELSSNSLEVTQ